MGQKGYTHEEFVKLAKVANSDIEIMGKFINTSTKILVKCKHSQREIIAWQALKSKKYCCSVAYHEQRVPFHLKSLSDRIKQYSPVFDGLLDFSNSKLGTTQKLDNIKCNDHNIIFSQWFDALRQGIGCPQCGKENKHNAGVRMLKVAREKQLELGNAKYVSKQETQWLDSLGIPVRQKWLDDVKYNVDGYDPSTNTVYLYHGRFWHGCLETYNADDIHPILKVKMKQLHDQTISWENKIKNSGYNLIVKWGK